MAYVATNEKNIAAIRHHVNNLRGKEVASLPQPKLPAFPMEGPENLWLRKIAWGVLCETEFENHPELDSKETWDRNARVCLTDLYPSADAEKAYTDEWNALRSGHSAIGERPQQTIAIPLEHISIHRLGVRSTAIKITRRAHPYFEEYAEWYHKREEIELRWRKIYHRVAEFLRNCKSLNEALKLWPDLKHYIPRDLMSRVEEKTERNPREKSTAALDALANIDKDVAVSSAVVARLAGAEHYDES